MKPRIRRIRAYTVRVPVPVERINCPEFAHETLNKDSTGKFGGEYFANLPFYIVLVEGDAGPAGCGSVTRVAQPDVLRQAASQLLGRTADEFDARRAPMQEIWSAVTLPPDVNPQRVPNAYKPHFYKGVDTAVLDWVARQRGMPFYRHFGEQLRSRVRCEYWSAYRTPKGAAEVAHHAKSLGFLGLKLKGNLEMDTPGIVQAVLDAAGPEFDLNIDPNARWENLENCLERVRPAVKINPRVLYEDPVTDVEIIAELRKRTGCRTAVSVNQPQQVERAAALDAVDVFNTGGVWPVLRSVSAAIERTGKPFWIGSSVEAGITDVADLHFACTQPGCTAGSDQIASLFREDDLLASPIRYEQGYALVPEGAGLGLDVDMDAVERYRCGEPIVVE